MLKASFRGSVIRLASLHIPEMLRYGNITLYLICHMTELGPKHLVLAMHLCCCCCYRRHTVAIDWTVIILWHVCHPIVVFARWVYAHLVYWTYMKELMFVKELWACMYHL